MLKVFCTSWLGIEDAYDLVVGRLDDKNSMQGFAATNMENHLDIRTLRAMQGSRTQGSAWYNKTTHNRYCEEPSFGRCQDTHNPVPEPNVASLERAYMCCEKHENLA